MDESCEMPLASSVIKPVGEGHCADVAEGGAKLLDPRKEQCSRRVFSPVPAFFIKTVLRDLVGTIL